MEKYGIRFHIFPYICRMIKREAQKKLEQLGKTFKVIAVIGPRQTGKTTLVKKTFPNKAYYSLENPDTRNFALVDPRGFLDTMPDGAILDEVQRAPEIFSYLQEILDNSRKKGFFILTGSTNFLLQESITQTLAGRVGYLHLLPFSISELKLLKKKVVKDDRLMVSGFYPPVHDQKISPLDWYPNYTRTYIERDVRQIKNISNLIVFDRFLRLLAGRTGQELNLTSISIEVGMDVKTIQSWIGVLENSFIIYLLKPHHRNYNKTIVKRPKVYFYDTGLVCSLIGISEPAYLANHPLRGAIFETMVVIEVLKKRTNAGLPINLFYWRDKTGHEIDLIIDNGDKLLPVEIKSGKTVNGDYFKNIHYWNNLSKEKKGLLLYGGDQKQQRSDGILVTHWQEIP